MNLVRNIQQASLFAGIILASLFAFNNSARADQKACVVTDAGVTVCGRLTSIKPPTNNRPPVVDKQVQIDNFTFSLKGCKRNSKIVKCIFKISNKGREETQINSLVGGSYIIDSSGTSYRADSVDMGGSSSGYDRTATIVPSIDSFASIKIVDVPLDITQAEVLEFNTNLGGKIQFRDVPIVK
jgi:hypothetical protein